MKVTVQRNENRYRRSVNGAWMSAGRDTEKFEIEESKIDSLFSLGSGVTVTWPDGVSESAFPFSGGSMPGYPPDCFPIDGRLAKLLAVKRR